MKDMRELGRDIMDALYGREYSDEEIMRMSATKIFDEYCEWHGLSGWGPHLRRQLTAIKRATRKKENDNA